MLTLFKRQRDMWVFGFGVLLCGVPLAELACTAVGGQMTYLSGQRLTGHTYINDTVATVDVCALLCISESLCESFNYNVLIGACERNYETGDSKPSNLQSESSWLYTESVKIPKTLAGVCANHMCQREEQCRPLGGVATCIKVNRCYNMVNGRAEYDGTLSTTRSGYSCQRWDDHTTHSHLNNGDDSSHFSADDSLEEAANYCRTPTTDGEIYPWCYTTDPNKRWEFCDLPEC
ncbi:plasminogen-like [Haliotis cracherodii]|uniref:plasminogen-like n=1 Tax=Haliotis cracherodii TaxID=6455 RepID=UPI0039EC9790